MRQQSQVIENASTAQSLFADGAFVDLDKEIDRLRRDTSSKTGAGRNTKMVIKYPEFRIVLITMNVGSKWEDHKTNSRIFVQVLRGQICFRTANNTFELSAGQLLVLDPGVLHSVESPQESAFLLTLSDVANRSTPTAP